MRFLRLISAAAIAGALFLMTSPEASARKQITGTTRKTSTAGCSCHGSATTGFSVAISGPTTLNVGQTGTYTVTLGGSTTTGVNIAASDGTLGVVTTQLTLLNGELTFTSARNANTWTFTYTPTTAGTKTLYANGDMNGFPGSWNWASNYAVTASAATSVEPDQPLTFALDQNYPNPFNPSTTIRYSIARPMGVTLEVVDLSGNSVATLVRGEQQAGIHEVVFDASRLASGVYLYRLTAGEFSSTKKLLLMK
jgi:hypothetical protein